MASMREIKRRKGSIQSTQQITKAMKLVSTVKLQRAKGRAESSKPYFDYMYDTVSSMLAKSGNISHPYLQAGDSPKKAIIVITSNRGLAGGYNSNITKLIRNSDIKKEDAIIYAVGRKGKETLARYGYEVKADYSEVINEPMYKDAAEIGAAVLEAFSNNEVGEIYLAYTRFKNTVTHIPSLIKLLPIDPNMEKSSKEESEANSVEALTLMNYEPSAEEALDMIIPKYMNSLIYGALVEALASENGARMQAMDSATNNAEEMISDLSLSYNRARQSSITQELTEIVAGASAIN
ncbi:ATP synthase F1 subcomplex gamma subunit [Anaerosporobacter mobilis DSM 15930]|uniref:ATP synthase gamma chain n=1 Tax=Anaerosporobacter mobilis DSM 15930 TaxID=1120996 RepID=A0A1M7IZN8_9FIRM|nr:ATP synthase F1 subunit gamma [Anaerosporobacter mobilis]SHM46206.1 ATP synthase F1 subcomplex gamma subunit [Anaerosporobacter mobilis DSM 15930]